jgi:hypothetical protein
MASSLGSLVVSLGLDAAQFVDGLTKSEYQARAFVRNVTATTTRMVGVFAAVGVAAGGALAVLGKAAGAIAVYQDLADQVGDTAEAVAGLQLAADLSGQGLDTVARASVKLTDALAKADDESKGVGAALAAINVPLDEFKQLDPVAQLERVAQALAGFEDGAGKTAVAVALFGRAGAELIPFLNDLAETGGRNLRLTKEQIAAADDYAKKYDRLKSEIAGFVQVVTAEAIPAASTLATEIGNVLRESMGAGGALKTLAADGSIRRWSENAAVAMAVVVESFVFAAKAARVTVNAFGAAFSDVKLGGTVAKNMFGGFLFESNRKDLADALADRNKTVADFNAQLDDLINYDGAKLSRTLRETFAAGDLVGPPAPTKTKPTLRFTVPGAGGKGGKGAGSMFGDIEDQAARTRQAVANLISNSEVAAAREYALQMEFLDKLFFDLGLDAQVYDSAMKGLTHSTVTFGEDGRKALEDQASAWLDTLDPQREVNRNLEKLNRMLEAGIVTPAQAEALRKMFADANKELSEMDQFAIEAARNIQDAFGDTLYDAMQGNFDDIAGSFKRMIDRMVAEALAAQLARKLMGDFGKTGEIGGWFGAGLNWLLGAGGGGGSGLPVPVVASAANPFGVAGLAGGGPVEAGGLYRVNERRTEMLSVNGKDYLMAGAAGRVRPNPQLTIAGEQRPVVQMTVYANDAESFRRSENQIVAGLGARLGRGSRVR